MVSKKVQFFETVSNPVSFEVLYCCDDSGLHADGN